MPERDAAAPGAQRAGRAHIVLGAGGERGGAHQPGHRRPADQGHDSDDAEEAGIRPVVKAELAEVDRRQHDQQRQQRQGDHAVGQPHERGIEGAAAIARQQAEARADQRGDERRGKPDRE